MEQEPRESTSVELICDNIANAPSRVEVEFSRTSNTWLECFGSRIFQLETLLYLRQTKAILSPEAFQRAVRALDELKEHHHRLVQEYPDRETIPSADIQQELFKRLDIFDPGHE